MEECGGARDGGGELAMSNTCFHSSPGARRGAKRRYMRIFSSSSLCCRLAKNGILLSRGVQQC